MHYNVSSVVGYVVVVVVVGSARVLETKNGMIDRTHPLKLLLQRQHEHFAVNGTLWNT